MKQLWDMVVLSGFAFVEEELEAERTALCGARYAHQEQRQAVRAGHGAQFLGFGRPPHRYPAAARSQRRGTRTELAKLVGVEFMGSSG